MKKIKEEERKAERDFALDYITMRKRVVRLQFDAYSYYLKNSDKDTIGVTSSDLQESQDMLNELELLTPDKVSPFTAKYFLYSAVNSDPYDRKDHEFKIDKKSVAGYFREMVKLSESAYSLQSIAFDFSSILEELGDRGESDEPNRKYNNFMDFMQSEVQCYGMFRIKKLRNWLWCYGNQNQRTIYEERIRSELQKTYEILQPLAEDVLYNRDPMYPNRLQQCPMWLLTEYTDIWDICEMLADSIDSTDGTKRITSKEYSETGELPEILSRLRHILKNTFNGRRVSSAQVREELGFEPSRLFAPSKKVIDRPIELRKKHFQETLRGPWQWRE